MSSERNDSLWFCPGSGSEGTPVRRITVKALVNARALPRLGGGEYRYCPTPACDVVYFDAAGSVFSKSDVNVRVGGKERSAPRPICYCFGYSEEDVQKDSAIARIIEAEVRAGRCACEVKNPKGTCCLDDVRAELGRLESGSRRYDRNISGGTMAVETARILTFREFWPFYVSQHQKSGTRLLHFIGTSLGLILFASALFTGRPFLVLWGLVAAYGFAWIGHYFIEKNRPATFQYPLWSFLGDLKMYGMMWRGRMGAELQRLGFLPASA